METWAQPFVFEPCWTKCTRGQKVDVVIQLTCVGSDMSLGLVLPSKTPCSIVGLAPTGLTPCITLFAASVQGSTGVRMDLQLTPASVVRAHGLPSVCDVLQVVEFCAGMGASSLGLQAAGFQQACAVEWMPAFVKLHEAIHPQVPVVPGDISDTQVLIEVHHKVPKTFTLMSGVSCQPFSRGGSGGGGNDLRSSTFPATLRACHLFQCPVLIIECVAPASENLFVRQHLNALKEHLGYHLVETQLKLEETWTACRHRWWVIACHPNFRVNQVPPMPYSRLVVRDLMPFVKEWDDAELEALQLKGAELRTFKANCINLRQFSVNLDKKLPTALHSWGQQTVPCACGCRESGFSEQLLRERGLFAQILPVKSTNEEQQWRHMHAQEVALLNGVPPLQEWLPNPRLNLCAVGQIASPLQAVWVGSHVLVNLQHQFGMQPQVEPTTCLHDLKSLVIQQSQSLFPRPPPATLKSSGTSVVRVFWDRQEPFNLAVHPQVTATQLLDAEKDCNKIDVTFWCIRDLATMEIIPPEGQIAGKSVSIEAINRDVGVNGVQSSPSLESVREISPLITSQHAATQIETTQVHNPENEIPLLTEPAVAPDEGQIQISSATTSTWKPSALLNLSGKQLTALIPPTVPDHALCEAMREQKISSHDRTQIVDNQDTVWGDDEIVWHIKQCLSHCGKDTVWLDPLLAMGWAHSSECEALQAWYKLQIKPSCIVTCLLSHGHWTPVIWRLGAVLQVHTWDHESVS